MLGKANFLFKCSPCGTKFDHMVERDKASEVHPPCPNCGSSSTKRVWTFGQFTFKGGLPSNHGRDGVYR